MIYGHPAVEKALTEFHSWSERVPHGLDTSLDEYDYDAARQEADAGTATSLAELTHLAKAEGFESESEVRVVTTLSTAREVTKFRTSRYGVVRYVELAAGPTSQGFVVRCEKYKDSWARLPIVSVVVGPAPYAERGLGAVRRLLLDNGYDIKPTVSPNRFR